MKKSAFLKYLAALLLFGSNGIVAGHIALGSTQIVLCRTVIGSLLLSVLFFLTGGRLTFPRHRRASLFLAASGIAMGASWMLLYEAYARIGVSIASLLYYCGPVLVMALSPLLFRERLTAVRLAGFAAVLGGIVLINGDLLGGGGDAVGIACGLLSAVMYAAMVICNKKAAPIAGMENAALQLCAAALTVALCMCVRGGFAMQIPRASILPILLLGVVNTGIGCFLYFSSIGELPIQTVAVCGYLEPLSAVLFSVALLGERMTGWQVLGAALILGGAMLGELRVKK